MSVVHASVCAARRRVLPIIITGTTPIGGLLALALGLGGKSPIWGPVAAMSFNRTGAAPAGFPIEEKPGAGARLFPGLERPGPRRSLRFPECGRRRLT